MSLRYTILRYPSAANALPAELYDEAKARRLVEMARRMGVGKAVSALASQRAALEKAWRVALRVRELCARRGWRLVGVYLVGSRARGDYTAESDVDLVVVVEGVRGLNVLERLQGLAEALEAGVDLLVYDVSEWESGESAWVRALRREARRIL